jgi:hypothetical protein
MAHVIEEAVLRLEDVVERAVHIAEVHSRDELVDVLAPDAHLPAPGAHDPDENLPAIDELKRGLVLGAGSMGGTSMASMAPARQRSSRGRCVS